MNKTEAFRILGIAEDEDPEDIRKKYRDLIRRHHPDMAGLSSAQLEKTQQLTQAYRLLKSEGYFTASRIRKEWGIKENKAAYAKRSLFMEEELSGAEMIVDTGISGKYYWDPELESFPLFLKSVNGAVQRILQPYMDEDLADDAQLMRSRVKLLHLLIQQFVNPYEAIRMTDSVKTVDGKPSSYRIPCHVKNTGDFGRKEWMKMEYPVRLKGNNLAADLGDGASVISFTENALYYIITPMILQGAASGVLLISKETARKKRYLDCELLLNVEESKGWDATEKINREIRRTLAALEGAAPCESQGRSF